MTGLQQYREQLQTQLEGLINNSIKSVQNTDGRIDVIESPANNTDEEVGTDVVEVDVALEELALNSILAIEAALKRIDRGEFGICIDCDGEIPAARLEAFPAAARCLSCKEKFEASNE